MHEVQLDIAVDTEDVGAIVGKQFRHFQALTEKHGTWCSPVGAFSLTISFADVELFLRTRTVAVVFL